ncbi:MAG: hypothetical protein IPK00_23670 [Deltaproteobacteria bacterium]|nr:hypothetical protein [Deltaproteobacteria bacterium]
MSQDARVPGRGRCRIRLQDIEADVRWAEELREKTGGNAIPLVEIDGSRIRGFDPDQMTSLLD